MRILHVLDHSLPLHSGYSFRTLAILREQHALGWETAQLTTPRHGETASSSEECEGIVFRRTPVPKRGLLNNAVALYVREMAATARSVDELCESLKPDIIHAHSPVLNALPALRVGRRRGIPVVYEVRALWEDAAVDHGSTREGSLRYRVSRALETFAMRRADHVTTICEGLREEIISRRVLRHRITVVPNAVDTLAFRVDDTPDTALRARLGLEGKIVVGFAGSFYAYEGLDLLLEAAAMLADQLPSLRVLLVGGGPQEEALRKLAVDRGLADRVVFTGRIPHGDVNRYYGLVDVLVYPRRRIRLTEIVTPLKPLEAMAQGKMLVASDIGGHRELIRDGETGFLFAAGDVRALARTLERVLAERAGWPRVRDQARRFVEAERTWARSVARYTEVYQSLSAARARHAEPLGHAGS
jgi:PEP-CTERM/exosortase A-associated glycosyltransferase